MSITTSKPFIDALVEAGVITRDRLNRTARIVIDMNNKGELFVYTQEYGDGEALAKLAPMLKGMIPDA